MRMRLVLALSISSCISLAACSSSSTTPTSNFGGLWSCTQSDALTFTTPANAAPQTNTTSTELDVIASVTGALTVTTLLDSGATVCSVGFSSSASSASLSSGQKCTSGGLSLAYSGGTATVTGGAMTATLSYTFTGTLSVAGDGGGTTGEAIAGSGTSTYQCTKTSS